MFIYVYFLFFIFYESFIYHCVVNTTALGCIESYLLQLADHGNEQFVYIIHQATQVIIGMTR